MQQVHDFLLRQCLLHHQTEEDGVSKFAEVMEEIRAGVRILDNVLERGLVVSQDSGRTVVVAGKLALLWHSLHQGLGEVKDITLDETLDDLEKFLDDDGDALVAKELGHAPKVGHANET